MKKHLVLSVCLVLAVVPFVHATPIVYSVTYSDDVSMSPTDWDTTLTIPKFDMPGYELESVIIALAGNVTGLAQCENTGPSDATVRMNLRSEITLQRPDGSVLAVTIPFVSTTDNLTGYDGVTDYAGTSGRTYTNLVADKTETATFTSASDLSLFTGGGNIVLPVLAEGISYASGAGNLQTSFTTEASSSASVTYNYVWVPEPLTISLLIGGLGCLIRRR